MLSISHVEELEINFAAFVNSARNVTFVLQKEFNKDSYFIERYEVKQNEMSQDKLCKFFYELRSSIIKEGINKLEFSTQINQFNSGTDMINQPANATIVIKPEGMYYFINKNTPQEDLIPALTKGKISTRIIIKDSPVEHLGKNISDKNIIDISQLYYLYLKNLVEEWTGILNLRT